MRQLEDSFFYSLRVLLAASSIYRSVYIFLLAVSQRLSPALSCCQVVEDFSCLQQRVGRRLTASEIGAFSLLFPGNPTEGTVLTRLSSHVRVASPKASAAYDHFFMLPPLTWNPLRFYDFVRVRSFSPQNSKESSQFFSLLANALAARRLFWGKMLPTFSALKFRFFHEKKKRLNSSPSPYHVR